MKRDVTRRFYGVRDAVRLSGFSEARIRLMARSRYLPRIVQKGEGHGREAAYLFSFGDLAAMRLVDVLRRHHEGLDRIRTILACLGRNKGWDDPRNRTRLLWRKGDDLPEVVTVADLPDYDAVAFEVWDLERVACDLERDVRRLDQERLERGLPALGRALDLLAQGRAGSGEGMRARAGVEKPAVAMKALRRARRIFRRATNESPPGPERGGLGVRRGTTR